MTKEKVFEECLAWFEAYRRLGFASEQIFFAVNHDRALMILRTQGLQFAGIAGPMKGNEEEIYEQWRKKAEEWNAMTHEQTQAIWEKSFVANHPYELVMAMMNKGIVLPAVELKKLMENAPKEKQ